jgi:hypothetical protein
MTVPMARGYAEAAALAGRPDDAGLPLAVDLRGVRKSFGPVQAVRGRAGCGHETGNPGTDPGPGGLARKRFLLDLDAHVSGRASRLP